MSNNNKNTELCQTEVKHIFETSFIKKGLIVIDKKRVSIFITSLSACIGPSLDTFSKSFSHITSMVI